LALAALTRAFRPDDVAHAARNAKGEPVRQREPA
jgi:hypothetical protein